MDLSPHSPKLPASPRGSSRKKVKPRYTVSLLVIIHSLCRMARQVLMTRDGLFFGANSDFKDSFGVYGYNNRTNKTAKDVYLKVENKQLEDEIYTKEVLLPWITIMNKRNNRRTVTLDGGSLSQYSSQELARWFNELRILEQKGYKVNTYLTYATILNSLCQRESTSAMRIASMLRSLSESPELVGSVLKMQKLLRSSDIIYTGLSILFRYVSHHTNNAVLLSYIRHEEAITVREYGDLSIEIPQTFNSNIDRYMPKFDYVKGGYRTLNDDYPMPMIGLDISRITGQDSVDESVLAALKAGYRLFDTATIYENEKQLGDALRKNLPLCGLTREDVFIITKVAIGRENTEETVRKAVWRSLEILQTSYLDLVLVQNPRDTIVGSDENYGVNRRGRETVWKTLETLKGERFIRSLGVSNYMACHLMELFEYAQVIPAVNQVEFHTYLTQDHVRQMCKTNNIMVQAYSSLCWGNKEILNEPAVQKLAKKNGVSPQSILYAFALNNGVSIIPFSCNPQGFASAMNTVHSLSFSPDELASLHSLDRNTAFCPHCEPWKCV